MNASPARRAPRLVRPLLIAALCSLAVTGAALAQGQARTDPRVGLRAGWTGAGEAAWSLQLVTNVPRPAGFFNPEDPGDFGFANSDLAFSGTHAFIGNFNGIQIYDIANPARPALRLALNCPGGQGDVSVHGNLLFMSVEETRGRLDCGSQGVEGPVSAERFVGVRVLDITNIENPRQVAAVQTCRGSHTHTLLVDPDDRNNVYIYVAGSAPIRSAAELPGCVDADPAENPNSARFRIEVIKVPVANPERAAIVASPRIFNGLTAPPEHGEAPEDIAAAAAEAAAARARGGFTAVVFGTERVLPDGFAMQLLQQMVQQRNGTGTPTAADSAALRTALPSIIAQMTGQRDEAATSGPGPGPTQCHDITVYPEIGLAGGACEGYGLLLDIRNPERPVRLAAVADSNFAYWHSATFSNDGAKVIFTDEWGGGTQAKCRVTDKPEWGANALFTRDGNALRFRSYYKLPAPQTPEENCVAHNGSLVPIPGRDIMAQAWYQGGISLLDFTDPANPIEIAYFDRGPIDASRLVAGGHWSVYWYNGYLYASEIMRGLDVFKLTPGEHLSAHEIAAAEGVRVASVNAQHQQKLTWTPSVSLSRAYLDQLTRHDGIEAAQAAWVRAELNRTGQLTDPGERSAAALRLAQAARRVETEARATGTQRPADPAKLRLLAASLRDLGQTMR